MTDRTKTAPCLECGRPLRVVRKDYLFTESGLDNVVLKNIQVLVCGRCKLEAPVLHRINDVMRTIAAAIVRKPYKLQAQEMRFLRKFLQLTGEKFAQIVKVDRAHLSRVENGSLPVSDAADRLIRLIALCLGDLWADDAKKDIIGQFADIQAAQPVRLMVDSKGYKFEAA